MRPANHSPCANGTIRSCAPCHTHTGTRITDRSNPHGCVKAMSSSNQPQIPVADRIVQHRGQVLGELPGRRRLVDIGDEPAERGSQSAPVTSASCRPQARGKSVTHPRSRARHRTLRDSRRAMPSKKSNPRRPTDPRRRPWRTRSPAPGGAPRKQGCAGHPRTIPSSRTDRRRDGPRSARRPRRNRRCIGPEAAGAGVAGPGVRDQPDPAGLAASTNGAKGRPEAGVP